jgi:hypothetical protein
MSGHAYGPDGEFVALSSSAALNEEGYAVWCSVEFFQPKICCGSQFLVRLRHMASQQGRYELVNHPAFLCVHRAGWFTFTVIDPLHFPHSFQCWGSEMHFACVYQQTTPMRRSRLNITNYTVHRNNLSLQTVLYHIRSCTMSREFHFKREVFTLQTSFAPDKNEYTALCEM